MRRLVMMGLWAALLVQPACDHSSPAAQPAKASGDATATPAGAPSGRRPPRKRPPRQRPRKDGRAQRPKRPGAPEPNAPPGGAAQPAGPPSGAERDRELVVAVRIHLLQSAELDLLHTSMTDEEARALIQGANEAFAPAKVRFTVESILREQAQNVEVYAQVAKEVRAQGGGKKAMKPQLKRRKKLARDGTLPLDQRIERGIDIYVHRALLNAGGLFTCRHRAIIFGQFRGGRKAAPNTAKVMAHELGHALGLPHALCADAPNLMMEACPKRKPNAIALTQEQIATVRKWAATGGPQNCPRGGEDIED